LPNSLDEVLDFIRYLKYRKSTETREITAMSESSLSKDWLKPEEDEAWKELYCRQVNNTLQNWSC